MTIRAAIPEREYPNLLARALIRHRKQRGLIQKQVAKQIGVSPWTYRYWEDGTYQPSIRRWPEVIAFLGYDPHPEPTTLGEHLLAERRALGLPGKQRAREYGIDEGTYYKLEAGIYEKIDPRISGVVNLLQKRFKILRPPRASMPLP